VIVYQSIKSEFLDNVFTRDIETVILEKYRRQLGHGVSRQEVRSWKESLLAMAKVLNHDSIPDNCGVAVEYGIPQTSKRIDMLISGRDEAARSNLLIVELKQWEAAKRTSMDAVVRTRFSKGEADTNHPSYQSWSYAELLRNFNETVHGEDLPLQPCAYLHNCRDGQDLLDPFYAYYTELAPLFMAGDQERERLRGFIARHVRQGDRGELIYRIENGRIRPSRRLIDALTGMMTGKREFVLIDDQKLVYETALARAASAQIGIKQVLIVDGGPGTGKSVVAINLLVTLIARDLNARYVSKNRAPRQVIEHTLAGALRRSKISSLFGGSGAFVDASRDEFDVLIVDEAHRLNDKSGLYGNRGENQVSEIISASRCAIFFLDEDQRVTWKDVGERDDIAARARKAGAEVTLLRLESQFRCNGSDGYLAWLDDALGIRGTANSLLDPQEYDFRVLDSPQEVRRLIEARNAPSNRGRMVAGYCWDWKSKSNPQAMDVVIPEKEFGMQWNLAADEGLWITAKDSVRQIGCIHTCQGLEVDYIGVIIGPDLIVRNDQVQTRPEMRSKQDHSIRGYKAALKTDPQGARAKADSIIRNTYRTLMTRGLKGCYIYCTDPETAAYFRSRIIERTGDASLRKVAEESGGYGQS
jgi:DUF2075 family protein